MWSTKRVKWNIMYFPLTGNQKSLIKEKLCESELTVLLLWLLSKSYTTTWTWIHTDPTFFFFFQTQKTDSLKILREVHWINLWDKFRPGKEIRFSFSSFPVCLCAHNIQNSETFVLHPARCSNAKEKLMWRISSVPLKNTLKNLHTFLLRHMIRKNQWNANRKEIIPHKRAK